MQRAVGKLLHAAGMEQGLSLLEMVVIIAIAGITLPILFLYFGQANQTHLQNRVMRQCVSLAASRMEQIIAFKENTPGWETTIQQFVATEVIDSLYVRETRIAPITGWGSANLKAIEVQVRVTHPALFGGYSLVLRLRKST